jgi:hypothetical protein
MKWLFNLPDGQRLEYDPDFISDLTLDALVLATRLGYRVEMRVDGRQFWLYDTDGRVVVAGGTGWAFLMKRIGLMLYAG